MSGYGDPHDPQDPYAGYGNTGETELTKFDKLAIRLILTGAFVIVFLHVMLVDKAVALYSPLDDVLPGLTQIVFHVGFAAASALLLCYLAYYGARVRRLYDSPAASRVLFLGLVLTVATNGLLVYALYSPASGATEIIRNAGRQDDDYY